MGIGIDLTGLGSIVTGAGTLAKDLRAAITGEISPDKKAELESRAMELESAAMSAQTEINKVEASSASLFVAGWRPAVGWICAFGLAYAVIFKPFIEFIANLFGYAGSFPTIEGDILNTTLYGMLGLGLFRTAEKITGSAGKH